MPIRTLPAVMLRLEMDLIAPTGRAGNAIGPSAGNHVVPAVLGIGKIYDSLLKGNGFLFDTLSVPYFHGIVKYIYTVETCVFGMIYGGSQWESNPPATQSTAQRV